MLKTTHHIKTCLLESTLQQKASQPNSYKNDPFCRNWVDFENNFGQPISCKTRVNPIPTNLTLFCRNWVDSKNDPGQPNSRKTRVNPIPTNLTLFCRNWVDLKNDQKKSTQFLQSQPNSYNQSQPNSYKVNPIPTIDFESTQFLQIVISTQFLQPSQPNYS